MITVSRQTLPEEITYLEPSIFPRVTYVVRVKTFSGSFYGSAETKVIARLLWP